MVNKKGALELSINAIVIVILAMTLLGLGLSFVRGIFKNFTGTTNSAMVQMQEQVMEDLRSGDKKLSFPSSEVEVQAGDEDIVVIGIKNTNPSYMYFDIVMDEVKTDSATQLPIDFKINSDPDLRTEQNKYSFFWDVTRQSLGPGDANTFVIKVKTDRTATGTKLFRIRIISYRLDGTYEEYASKTFFLKLR